MGTGNSYIGDNGIPKSTQNSNNALEPSYYIKNNNSQNDPRFQGVEVSAEPDITNANSNIALNNMQGQEKKTASVPIRKQKSSSKPSIISRFMNYFTGDRFVAPRVETTKLKGANSKEQLKQEKASVPKKTNIGAISTSMADSFHSATIKMAELTGGNSQGPIVGAFVSSTAITPALTNTQTSLPEKKIDFLPIDPDPKKEEINKKISSSLTGNTGIHVFTYSANTEQAKAIHTLNECLDKYWNGSSIPLDKKEVAKEIKGNLDTVISSMKKGGGQAIPFYQHFQKMREELGKINSGNSANVDIFRTRVVGVPTISYSTKSPSTPKDEEIQASFTELQKYANSGALVHVFADQNNKPLIGGGGGIAQNKLGSGAVEQQSKIHQCLEEFVSSDGKSVIDFAKVTSKNDHKPEKP